MFISLCVQHCASPYIKTNKQQQKTNDFGTLVDDFDALF